MATSLMSLMSTGPIKHVVPWKNRSEFLDVYQNLYSGDEAAVEKAIDRISTWKSRAGPKLSVAIESSGMLMQARIYHIQAERQGKLRHLDSQLRSTYSIALIRFVNHVTEKGQTKATAQPVHLLAREFGIPEWIVRLRHDATHAVLPCLDTLATGTKWALNYLGLNFWEQQKTDQSQTTQAEGTVKKLRGPKMAEIRKVLYNFQKVRYEQTQLKSEQTDKPLQSENLKTLQKYLEQNRLRFIKCLLEDGFLVSTAEQLDSFDIDFNDLLSHSPPSIPAVLANFWRPLLRRLHVAQVIPFLVEVALFSATSEEGLRNYQLVAWIAFFLENSTASQQFGKRKRKVKSRKFFSSNLKLDTKTLLAACIQNINKYTVHLLKYVVDKDSMGPETYSKVMKLLRMNPHTGGGPDSNSAAAPVAAAYSSSEEASNSSSDSDSVYTLEDVKKAKEKTIESFSPTTVRDIQKSIGHDDVPWKLCTDLVDWSSVPIGVVPEPTENEDDGDDDNGDDDDDDHDVKTCIDSSGKDAAAAGDLGDSDKDNDDDSDDDEDHIPVKRRRLSKSSSRGSRVPGNESGEVRLLVKDEVLL